MLDGVGDLTLDMLNKATQAWAEIEYNRTVHRETGCTPLTRFTRRLTHCARVPAASRSGTRFGWKPPEVSVRAMARSRWRGCGSRSRHGSATSAKSPSVTPAGTSAGSISSTDAVGLCWLRFTRSIKAPMPTAAVP